MWSTTLAVAVLPASESRAATQVASSHINILAPETAASGPTSDALCSGRVAWQVARQGSLHDKTPELLDTELPSVWCTAASVTLRQDNHQAREVTSALRTHGENQTNNLIRFTVAFNATSRKGCVRSILVANFAAGAQARERRSHAEN